MVSPDIGAVIMWFGVSILLVIAMLFLAYARWRWRSRLIQWILSGRKQSKLETESLRDLKEDNVNATFELQNNAIERMHGSKIRRLLAIVLAHIGVYFFLLLLYWRYIAPNPYANPKWYLSPRVRYIILLVMVVIVFPLVSVVIELKRRKIKRKKDADIQNRNGE
jgi:hypothetical protein